MRHSVITAAVFCALTLLTAACGTVSPPPSAAAAGAVGRAAAEPMPAGVEIGPKALAGSTPLGGSCHALSSVAPTGALPKPGHMPAGSTMAKIQARGYLLVGVDQTTLGFGYRNAQGHLVGFDDSIAQQVAGAIFGNQNAVRYMVITSAQRIPDVRSGVVDMVADNMTITCTRLEKVAFSEDYYNAGQTLLVPSSFPNAASASMSQLAGQRVCAAAGTTSVNTIGSYMKPYGVIPVSVPNWTDCLVMLQQGQVAAISTDNSVLVGLQHQDANTVMSSTMLSCEPHGLAMSNAPQARDLVRFVNGVLEQMRMDGEWQRLYDLWVYPYLGPQAQPRAEYNVAVEQACSWLG
jgi:polar amino acid transport system substrate-binding protein